MPKVQLAGTLPGFPLCLDAQAIALSSTFTFIIREGDLDLIGHVEPLGGYDDLLQNVVNIRFGELDVQEIALDDLIRAKQHTSAAEGP